MKFELDKQLINVYNKVFNDKEKLGKPNFRVYKKFFEVKNDKFIRIENSISILKKINKKLEDEILQLLKKTTLFDNDMLIIYINDMKKCGTEKLKKFNSMKKKELNKKENQEFQKLKAFINGNVVGSNWSVKNQSIEKIKCGIIVNQFDLACKVINGHWRESTINDVKERFEKSTLHSGFNINIKEFSAFIENFELPTDENKIELYSLFLTYILVTKTLRMNSNYKSNDINYVECFDTYKGIILNSILGSKEHENK